jgi:hypothetical protein
MEHPLDFQGEILLETRKQWGIILLGLLTVSALVPALFIYFKGYVLLGVLENLPKLFSGILPGPWQSFLGETIGSKVILFTDIKSVIELFWYNYSWYIMSVLVLIVVIYRSDRKTIMGLPKNN